jgi:hypothetical protein
MSRPDDCPRCKGRGLIGGRTQQANDIAITCPECDGKGQVGRVGLALLPHLTEAELRVLLRAVVAYDAVIGQIWPAIDVAHERSVRQSLQTAVAEAIEHAKLDERRLTR